MSPEILNKLILAGRLRFIVSIVRNLKAHQESIESLILDTPTGPERDRLTEANIHTLEAIVALGSISEVIKEEQHG